jgi:hypothetical protein
MRLTGVIIYYFFISRIMAPMSKARIQRIAIKMIIGERTYHHDQ